MKPSRAYWLILILLAAAAVQYGLARTEKPAFHEPLSTIPTAMGDWNSQDNPIEARLVAMAHVDEYVNRIYQSPSKGAVSLYVGYYKSQRAGDSVHSPKNCLPGTGWQPISASRTTLPLAGKPAEVNLYVVEHQRERFVVLYWYQMHGRIVGNEYRAKLYTIEDAIALNRTDSALVRVTVPVTADETRARQIAVDFATMMTQKIDEVLPH